MIKWIRPSGSILETGEGEGIEKYAKANGWKRADAPKRTRRTKAEMEEARGLDDGDSSSSN